MHAHAQSHVPPHAQQVDDKTLCMKQMKRRKAPTIAPTSLEFTEADAGDIALRLRNQCRLHQGGAMLLPPDAPAVLRYSRDVRRNLKVLDEPSLERLGFRLFEPCDNLLSEEEAQEILKFCQSIEWEPRRGSKGRHLAGTKRKNFGVDMDDAYHVLPGSTGQLPPILDKLGDRVLAHCQQEQWPYSREPVGSVSRFDQAYIQQYPPGGSSAVDCSAAATRALDLAVPTSATAPRVAPAGSCAASTLGFHFDSRAAYGELICGVTICGSGKFLLGSTNGTEFVGDTGRTMAAPNVRCIPLAPRSVYAISGLSRYDLRHAAVNDGDDLRVSITFRSVLWSKVKGKKRRHEQSPVVPAHAS